jgi:DNA repair protein RadC
VGFCHAVHFEKVTMPLSLEAALRLQPEPVRRFLDAAVGAELLTTDMLVAAGVPHYEATLYCRRLHAAGELVDGGWSEPARVGYRKLLMPVESPRRLDRMHEGERPREKALHSGIRSLSDTELLALLLRTGGGDEGVLEFADRLLADHDGLLGLARTEIDTLLEARGLGPAKATELAAAFELANRVASATRRRERPKLISPELAVEHLRELVLLDHERFWCLPLDPRSGLIGEPRQISQGDVDGTDAGPRAFYRAALTAGATSCIAVHNHPTGDPSASPADLAVTVRLVAAGRTLDVKLVDHVIVGDSGRFVSIRRNHPECFR